MDASTTFTTITNLLEDTEYTFRLRAQNKQGGGSWSTHSAKTNPGVGTNIPKAVSSISAGSITSSSISLNWPTPR